MDSAILDVADVSVRRLLLQCSSGDRRKASMVLGASSTKRGWTYPPDELVVQQIQGLFKERLVMTPACQAWFDAKIQWRHQLEAVRNYTRDDFSTNFPKESLLKDYQVPMIAYGMTAKRFINADDRGLGKTLEAIATSDGAKHQKTLVVAPGYLKLGWYREIDRWSQRSSFLCRGERQQRERIIREFVEHPYPAYLIVNYEMLREDTKRGGYPELRKIDWDCFIFDEAHRLKGRDSQQTKGSKSLVWDMPQAMIQLLTGNPIANKPDDVWSLLNMLEPKKFSSFWALVEHFCVMIDAYYGKEIGGINTARMAEFQYELMPYIFRRLKKEVAPYLPDKVFHLIEIELEGPQKAFYTRLEKQAVIELVNGDLDILPSVVEKNIRLQQALINPTLLGGVDDSVVERTTLDLLDDLLESSDKVIVGTHFIAAADRLEMLLKTKREKWNTFRIRAELKDVARDKVCEDFKKTEGKCVLVGSIRCMSEGLNIDECDNIVYQDKEWTILDNEQFEDRIHRITSTQTKNYYSIVVKNTISEDKESLLQDRTAERDEIMSMRHVAARLVQRVQGNAS